MLQTRCLDVVTRMPILYHKEERVSQIFRCFTMKPFGEVLMDAQIHTGRWIWRLATLAILLLLTLLSSACETVPTSNRPPNQEELQTFCDEQDISCITDKLLDDSSVLLYEKGDLFGYYTLTIQEPKGKMVILNQSSRTRSDQPIVILDKLSEEQPIMAVLIQDTKLLAETTAIEVVLGSNNFLTITIQDQKGAVLVSPSPVDRWSAINLYNTRGEILYSLESQ